MLRGSQSLRHQTGCQTQSAATRVTGRIESINTSRGGVPKESVFEAFVDERGLDGDRQRHRLFHGGRDRAVVLFSLEVIRALQHEGHPIATGTTGENLTLSGLDWRAVAPGAELAIGEVRLRITKYTSPCDQIAESFQRGDFSRISQKRHPGWSRVCARVLVEGLIRVGDPVAVVTGTPL
jgi:MOSC domain-containing protein YiiM